MRENTQHGATAKCTDSGGGYGKGHGWSQIRRCGGLYSFRWTLRMLVNSKGTVRIRRSRHGRWVRITQTRRHFWCTCLQLFLITRIVLGRRVSDARRPCRKGMASGIIIIGYSYICICMHMHHYDMAMGHQEIMGANGFPSARVFPAAERAGAWRVGRAAPRVGNCAQGMARGGWRVGYGAWGMGEGVGGRGTAIGKLVVCANKLLISEIIMYA